MTTDLGRRYGMRAWILSSYLLLTAIVSMVALIQVFPQTEQTAFRADRSVVEVDIAQPTNPAASSEAPASASKPEWKVLDELIFGKISILGFEFEPEKNSGQGLLILAILAGILGSFMHAAQSLTSYVGNKTFEPSWVMWYILRAPIGAVLGAFLYFVIRAGLLTTNTDVVSPYGVVAIAGLGGWFSKQATDKLAEIFDQLFSSSSDANRKDKLKPDKLAVKTVTVSPDSAGGWNLALAGTGFENGLVVILGSVELPAVVVSAEAATVAVPKDTFTVGAEPKTLTVKVGEKTSEPAKVDFSG